jgi:hypothetical protein
VGHPAGQPKSEGAGQPWEEAGVGCYRVGEEDREKKKVAARG